MKERGSRREWKRKYLQNWRARNVEVNESYWKGNERVREKNRIRNAVRNKAHHDALLIQGRLRRKGMNVTLKEAQVLLQKFGRFYPLRDGLTAEGLKECERIRSRLRQGNNKLRLTCFDIRLMVYDDGLFRKPKSQKRMPKAFKKAGKRLRDWHRSQRIIKESNKVI